MNGGDGAVLRSDRFGKSNWSSAFGIELTYDNGYLHNVIVVGDTYPNAKSDVFVQAYNYNLNQQWSSGWLTLGTSENEFSGDITLANDGSNSFFLSGYTEGNLDGNTNKGDKDIFISKYSWNGAGYSTATKDWTKTYGTSGFEYGLTLTTTSKGKYYISGRTTGDLEGETNSGGNGDIFVSEFDVAN